MAMTQTESIEGFCTSGKDSVRLHIDTQTGRPTGMTYTCEHGKWSTLVDARQAHSIQVSRPIAESLKRMTMPTRAGRAGDTQALPTPNDETDTQTKLIEWIGRRRQLGVDRYGTALQPNNGRDSLWDAVEESLDMTTYLLNFWREQNPGKDLPS